MDGVYQSRYTVECTGRHRQGTGKHLRFPRNSVQHVHKIIKQIYDYLFICHTTHLRCQTELINYHIQTLVWSLNVVWCITSCLFFLSLDCNIIIYLFTVQNCWVRKLADCAQWRKLSSWKTNFYTEITSCWQTSWHLKGYAWTVWEFHVTWSRLHIPSHSFLCPCYLPFPYHKPQQ